MITPRRKIWHAHSDLWIDAVRAVDYDRATKALDDLYSLVRKQGMDDELRVRIESILDARLPGTGG